MEIEDLKKELKKYLKDDEKRYLHSIGVMKMAQELAKKYGADVERAGKTGLMIWQKECQKKKSYSM